jgi:hypothetical protein
MCGNRKKRTNKPQICGRFTICGKCGSTFWRRLFRIGPDGKRIPLDTIPGTEQYEARLEREEKEEKMTQIDAIRPKREFSEAYIEMVNKTCRSNGCVGKNAVVPRIVQEIATEEDRILDFGAGKKAVHAERLKKESGLNVTAYEIGSNFDPHHHDERALLRTYSMIYCSNVMNVQPTTDDVIHILDTVNVLLEKDGKFVVNYPDSPRKNPDLDTGDFERLINKRFHNISYNGKVWVLGKI